MYGAVCQTKVEQGNIFLDHWFICCNCGLKPFAAICEFVPKLGNYLSWENVFSAVLWIKTFLSVVNNKSLFPIWKDSSENYNLCFSLGFMKSFGCIWCCFGLFFLRKYFVLPLKYFTQSKWIFTCPWLRVWVVNRPLPVKGINDAPETCVGWPSLSSEALPEMMI